MGLLDRFRTERVALLVDGPNVFREEFDVDLADLRAAGAGTSTSLSPWTLPS